MGHDRGRRCGGDIVISRLVADTQFPVNRKNSKTVLRNRLATNRLRALRLLQSERKSMKTPINNGSGIA
jgi:hypothetical protein